MSIAPLIRKALRRRLAKDSRDLDIDYGKCMMAYSNQETLLGPSTQLCEGSNKFWDSKSESKCEHQGGGGFSRCVVQPALRKPTSTTSTAIASSKATVATTASPSSPRRTLAPWKRLWKGTLPPRRIMLVATLGDFLLPALESMRNSRDSGCDPLGEGFQTRCPWPISDPPENNHVINPTLFHPWPIT